MIKSGRAPEYRDRTQDKIITTATRTASPTRAQILIQIVKRFINDRQRAVAALRELHDQKLYVEKYGTFENLCRDEFNIGRAYAYQLLAAEKINDEVEMSGIQTEKLNENQARALKSAPPDSRVEVLKEATKDGPATGRKIAEIVARRNPPPEIVDAEPAQQVLRAERPPITRQAEPEQKRKPCPTCGGCGTIEGES